MADDAGWCELLSATNSLINRERTGNFSIFEPWDIARTSKNTGSASVFQQIPYSTKQGIIITEQGILLADQGHFQDGAGKLISWAAPRETPAFSVWLGGGTG